MYLGPWFYYLIAPSLLIANFNPVGPAAFIALINVATIYLIFFIAKKWFSQSVGLISAFLFATSPVVIKYSNFIWNPNIMPFFALLFVFLFFEGLFSKKYHYFIYASLSFVMCLNSHYLALALLFLPGLYWLIELIKFIKNKSKHLKSFLIKAKKAGFKIVEIGVHHYPRIEGQATGRNIKVILKSFSDLFRLWFKINFTRA
jgi:4-amino-4-deoxy-L-arabinose transferase-like glycosyltransferase